MQLTSKERAAVEHLICTGLLRHLHKSGQITAAQLARALERLERQNGR